MNRIRTALFTLYVVVATTVIAIAASPTLLSNGRAARHAVKFWARSILWGLKAICGLRFKIEGGEHIPKGGAIVAANHQSMWETIALFAILPDAAMVFKRELTRVPLYGWWAVRTGSIPVDRGAGVQAIRMLMKAARAKIAEGRQFVVFPEGTRARLGERGPLQPGVVAVYKAAGAPCTPAVHNSGGFWRFPGRLGSLKLPGVITLRFYPPIEPGRERKAFIAELERRFDAPLGASPDVPANAPTTAMSDARRAARIAST